MAIEEEFSIEIPDKDADGIHSGTPLPPLLSPTMGAGRIWTLRASANSRKQSTRPSPTFSTSPMPPKRGAPTQTKDRKTRNSPCFVRLQETTP